MNDDLALLAIALAAAGTQLTSASQNVTGFNKQIADLQATIAGLQQQISVLSSQVTTDSSSMSAQAATIAALSARIDALNVQIQTLLKQIAALQTKPTVFDSTWHIATRQGTVNIDSAGVATCSMTNWPGDSKYGSYGYALLQKGRMDWGPATNDNLMQYNQFTVTYANLVRQQIISTLYDPLPKGDPYSMDVYVGFYYHFRQPITLNGITRQNLDYQAWINGVYTNAPGGELAYTSYSHRPIPQSNWTGSMNVKAHFDEGCVKLGIDPAIGYDAWGVEIGVEGYRIQSLKADFSNPVLS